MRIIHISVFMVFGLAISNLSFAQQFLDDGFHVERVTEDIEKPVGLLFDESGSMYVWEKAGRVWKFENGVKGKPILDISEEVMNYGDLGMMGFAMDPNYELNGYVYVYYAVDYHHLTKFGTSDYNPNKSETKKATIGRVARYTISHETGIFVPESRKVLIGTQKNNGIPICHTSHMGGTILFGDDGTLLISTGDGSTGEGPYAGKGPPFYNEFAVQALEDGIISPEEEVGAFRSQIRNGYNGKILRIDPETGLGITNNPFFDTNQPNAPISKVWVFGLRNPFRVTKRTGSGSKHPEDGRPGTLFIGDVGEGTWEELNILTGNGKNFGWPIFEGNQSGKYAEIERENGFALNPCNDRAFIFQDLIRQYSTTNNMFVNPCDTTLTINNQITFTHSNPHLSFIHESKGEGAYFGAFDLDGNLVDVKVDSNQHIIDGNTEDLSGNAIVAGPVYRGDQFPESHQNQLYIADFNSGWIRRLELDLNENITGIYPFYEGDGLIAHLEENPIDGCIYFIEYPDDIKKICFGQNVPPIVEISSDKTYGSSPLAIQFSSEGSYDPNMDSMHYYWEFGDGNVSNEPNPEHVYVSDNSELFKVVLKITDEKGDVSSGELEIGINNTPPEISIESSLEHFYSIVANNWVEVTAKVKDQESDPEEISVEWVLVLHHNDHSHEMAYENDLTTKFSIPPLGCEDELYFHSIQLHATDPHGLKSKEELFLYPDCQDKFADLLLFNADIVDNEVQLEWVTEAENGCEYFVVEKAGWNKEFKAIANVEAKNNDTKSNYGFSDPEPHIGQNYYRLKLVGISGSEAYSEERYLKVGIDGDLHIYPNPNNGKMYIYLHKQTEPAKILVYNMEGKLLLGSTLNGKGRIEHSYELPNHFPEGMYIIHVRHGERDVRQRILLQR